MFFKSTKSNKHSAGCRRTAFTLAEVLITLSIIGVVAAMTLPTLITNHQKNTTVQQLKKAYTTLANALNRARADYGDPVNWGYGMGDETTNSEADILNFAETYVYPYLSGAELIPYTDMRTLASFGYDEGFKSRDNTVATSLTDHHTMLRFSDGTIVVIKDEPVSINLNGENRRFNIGMRFYVDVNGARKPNTHGKDIFPMEIVFTENATLDFLRVKGVTITLQNGSLIKLNDDGYNREQLLENCRTLGGTCGALIQNDGWQISKDYPW